MRERYYPYISGSHTWVVESRGYLRFRKQTLKRVNFQKKKKKKADITWIIAEIRIAHNKSLEEGSRWL